MNVQVGYFVHLLQVKMHAFGIVWNIITWANPGPKGRYVDQPILGKLAFSLTWKLCQSQKLKNITPNLTPGKATFVFKIGKYVWISRRSWSFLNLNLSDLVNEVEKG
jgi:hypothetical protein